MNFHRIGCTYVTVHMGFTIVVFIKARSSMFKWRVLTNEGVLVDSDSVGCLDRAFSDAEKCVIRASTIV